MIDYVGKLNGEVFDGGTGFDSYLELGSGQFIPGFEDQLIGVKAGDNAVLNINFPAYYGTKN